MVEYTYMKASGCEVRVYLCDEDPMTNKKLKRIPAGQRAKTWG